jgi:hypothetical protein
LRIVTEMHALPEASQTPGKDDELSIDSNLCKHVDRRNQVCDMLSIVPEFYEEFEL